MPRRGKSQPCQPPTCHPGSTHRRQKSTQKPFFLHLPGGGSSGSGPVPNPRPTWQLLAFGLMVVPLDRQRNWVPFQPDTTNLDEIGTSSRGSCGLAGGQNGEYGFLHVVSRMEDCLDFLAVSLLMYSTLSSTRLLGKIGNPCESRRFRCYTEIGL